MFKISRKKVAAGIVAAGVLATTGVGYAYWTTTGSGAGSAGTLSAITVTLTPDAIAALAPGAPEDITGTVTVSDDATSAYINDITPSIVEGVGGTVWNDDGINPACSAADFDLDAASIDDQVLDGATLVEFGTIELLDLATNQDNCKHQALVLAYTSN